VHQHSTHRRWILSFVIILALALATPVLANYVGPNRTVTETNTTCKVVLNECRYVEEKGEWKYKTTNTWSCSLESKPWETYSNDSRPCNDNTHTPGYEYWSKEDVTTTQTVTYPPATITGSLENCTHRNGWCITVPQLSMEGIEPVDGYRIFSIEGTLNGQNFACMGPRCTVQLKQGQNDFAFWALSTFVTLDSSEMDMLSAKVDSKPPTITSSMTGLQGSNGWYLGPITFNGSAADATSGLVKITCDLDGAALSDCDMIRIKGDGPHLLHVLARDYALHVQEITLTPSIDSQNPTLSAFIDGTLGSNNWHTAATLNASGADASPGSGLATFEYNLDGSGWTAFPASGTLNLADGPHIVDLRAADNAGRSVSSSTSFGLDTRAPNVSLDSAGTFGSNDWYITSPMLTASASDDTSGLDSFEYSLDNGAWAAYTIPLSLSDGIHSVSIWAQDQAGLVTQVDRSYQVDTRAPQIAGSLSGTPGANGWFTSKVTVSASASDPPPGSTVDTFTYTLNGDVETPYVDPIVLTDGQHTLQLSARDKAGLSHSIEQTLKVDTIPPSATIDTAIPNWVKGALNLSGTANDNGSGLSNVELSFDEGQTWQAVTGTESWNTAWNTADGANGIHAVRLQAMDQAGLTTEQTVYVGVDNQSPEISLPDSWIQWDTVTLNISDEHIGLAEARVEISDPQGRWPARVIPLDLGQFPLAFRWDRRFGDDTLAEAGTYTVKVFASDSLGNFADKTASIRVLIDILPPGPTSTQANTQTPVKTVVYTATSIVPRTATPASVGTQPASPTLPANTPTKFVLVFGTMEPPAQATSTPANTPAPRTTPTQATAVSWLQSIFAPENTEESTTEVESPQEPETQPAPTNNSALWGTSATAAIAAVTMYIQEERRKRAEELARLKALEEAQEERRKKMQEKKSEKNEAQRAQEAAWEAAREAASAPASIEIKIARAEEEEALNNLKATSPAENSAPPKLSGQEKRTEHKEELIQEEVNSYTAKPQEWKTAYDSYMAQHALLAQAKEKEETASAQRQKKSWWEKTIEWVDDHQSEISLGVGIVIGATAVVLSAGLATPLVAVALVASATVTAGVTVASGTIALNNYYGRPWNENLLTNVALAGGAAAVVCSAGFIFQAAAAGISTFCTANASKCAHVEPVLKAIDATEEAWLNAKLTYQIATGNTAGAAETAFELHSEQIDGGMPGNAVAKEISELGSEALSAIAKYGDDVIPLLAKHGDEALEIIQKYGDDGIALLQKYGEEASKLIGSYGEYAVKVMKAVDPAAAKHLLQSLDDDVLEYALEQGPEAVEALAHWSPKELRLYGPQLALRAKNDAKALAKIKKLLGSGPIDPKNLTKEQKALIEAIAANSTQYAGEGQVVLGKWVDLESGFVETAQNTGSAHYNPNPEMWKMLGNLGEESQEQVAWLINKKVVQNGIDKGLPFEYTLNGIPAKEIANEGKALEAIFDGATDTEIMKILKTDKMPIRMKEMQELQKAGYKISFDDATNSFILVPK
jgi:hypothetical protein